MKVHRVPALIPQFVVLLLVLAGSIAHGAEPTQATRHTVIADGHPLAVWQKSAVQANDAILLVHGRTWSALPDFDLQVEGEELSLMDGLVDEGFAVYAVDLRGYGESARDESGWLTPDRAAADVAIVLEWIDGQQDWHRAPHLFGWSMGSTISQLVAQRHPALMSSLTLYGYWRDLDEVLPPDEPGISPLRRANTAEAAASDFITPGSISRRAIDGFVAAALASDPVRVDIRNMDHYNALDPAKVTVPTLVLQGEFDPIAPTDRQAKLFARLGTGHRQWVVIPGGDHAAHLEKPRPLFIHSLVSFIEGLPEPEK
ncbi:MAG TPA: alpha/beta fold hydrolase [Woeseiaceae bacterium]